MWLVRLICGATFAAAACSSDAGGLPLDGGAVRDADGSPDATVILPDDEGVARAKPLPADLTIRVNGNLDEWNAATFASFSDLTSHHVDEYAPGYAASVSVQYAIYHSVTSLYLAFRVFDGVESETSLHRYDDDSVEIYLDTDGDRSGAYESTDHYFLASYLGGCRHFSGAGFPPATCRSIYTSGVGYSIEAQIDLGSIGLVPLPPQIGFGLGVNDDDMLDNPDPAADDAADGYIPWFWDHDGGCQDDCCAEVPRAKEHTEPFCDTSRLGFLIFD